MTEPLIYIIILNWNGYKDTIACIESIERITYKNYIILIVDNGSTDESVKVFKTRFPNVKLMENQINLGFAGGCNVGINYALKNNANYVLLLNNDTIVQCNFLSELVDISESDTQIGILSPLIYYANEPDVIWSSGANINYKSSYPFIDRRRLLKDKGQLKRNINVDTVTGCCMLIKKAVFASIGLLDPIYFLYTEDRDFCARVKKKGYSIYVIPNSKVWHKVSSSSGGEGNPLAVYYSTRNLILYSKLYFSLRERLVFNYYFLRGNMYQFILNIKKRNYKKARAILIALKHGYTGKTGFIKFKY